MKLATVLTPPNERHFRLAAQCGVTHWTTRYPGTELSALRAVQQLAKSFGLELAVVEGYLPIERIKLGLDDGTELDALKQLVRNMGELGVGILCYNFMSGTDWVRTNVKATERGGALTTEFRLRDVGAAVDLANSAAQSSTTLSTTADDAGSDYATSQGLNATAQRLTPSQLWDHLKYLLDEILPVAEDANVQLAMHPDDPPLAEFLGRPRIMCSSAAFDRLLALAPSPSNGICFCQGTFAAMGAPIVESILHFGSAIKYVHFRDVRGTADDFVETFHDNGPTDMAQAMRAYQQIGFDGPIRPDHVPQLVGEEDGEPGYTMLGRLYAYGYLRGLMDAAPAGQEPP